MIAYMRLLLGRLAHRIGHQMLRKNHEPYHTIAYATLIGLQAYQHDNRLSYPGDMPNHDAWVTAVSEMIWAFTQIVNQQEDGYHLIKYNGAYKDGPCCDEMGRIEDLVFVGCDCQRDYTEQNAHAKRVQDGVALYGRYFLHLWH